nr:M14 family metallopeptidase [Litorivivens lipolytica]
MRVRKSLPEGFLYCRASELYRLVGEPCLIHLRGRSDKALIVSILLHGNETTGLSALQQLLKRNPELPRDLVIFVGNTRAAAEGLRRLDGQPDFNRIWAGGELKEHALAQEVLDYVASCQPIAAIDIHNNTGRNPLYACINHVDRRFLTLARRFSETIVFFTEPHQIFANNMARYCPAVTLECGQPGEQAGIEQASQTLEFALTNDFAESQLTSTNEIELFHTVARMTVPPDSRIAFDNDIANSATTADFTFPQAFDAWNFQVLPEGTPFAKVNLNNDQARTLCVRNDAGRNITDKYFRLEKACLVTRKAFSPTMLTLDERVIRQDCVGYIMERYPLSG